MATPSSWLQAVKDRIDEADLVNMTNAQAETQSPAPSISDTRLQACIDDALGEFATLAGFEALLTDPSHVGAVVTGTLVYLLAYKGTSIAEADGRRRMFYAKCRTIREVFTSAPGSTNSGNNQLTPTEEAVNGRVVRPDADRAHFRRYLPRNYSPRADRLRDY